MKDRWAAVRPPGCSPGLANPCCGRSGRGWHRIAEFGFDGRRYRQEEDYFLLRVESVEVSLAGLDTIELETVVGYRWWEAAGLESAGEAFFPAELPRLLRELTS